LENPDKFSFTVPGVLKYGVGSSSEGKAVRSPYKLRERRGGGDQRSTEERVAAILNVERRSWEPQRTPVSKE
jgi:hypothetical protein